MTKTKWTLISSMQKATKTKLQTMSKQLVDKDNQVLIGIATPSAQGLASATKDKTNRYGAVTDPVGANLVKDLKKPGGNINGVSDHNPTEQQLKLIKELTPNLKTIGILYSTSEDNSKSQVEEFTKLAEKQVTRWFLILYLLQNEIASTVSVMSGKVDAIWVPIDNTIASAFSTAVEANKKAKTNLPKCDSYGEAGGLGQSLSTNTILE